eukprot:133861_1
MSTAFTVQKLYLIVIYVLLNSLFANSIPEFFVGKEGWSSNDCTNWMTPCGSLYGVSTAIYYQTPSIEEATIHIIDGQNENEIQYFINYPTGYHPCFADLYIKINIIFNSSAITDLKDWFP